MKSELCRVCMFRNIEFLCSPVTCKQECATARLGLLHLLFLPILILLSAPVAQKQQDVLQNKYNALFSCIGTISVIYF